MWTWNYYNTGIDYCESALKMWNECSKQKGMSILPNLHLINANLLFMKMKFWRKSYNYVLIVGKNGVQKFETHQPLPYLSLFAQILDRLNCSSVQPSECSMHSAHPSNSNEFLRQYWFHFKFVIFFFAFQMASIVRVSGTDPYYLHIAKWLEAFLL